MKITCTQPTLKENLSLVNGFVPGRPDMEILSCILAIASKESQKITFVAFDGQMGCHISFDATVKQEGEIAIPAKMFADIVNRLPKDIDINIEVKDDVIHLKSSGKFKISAIDPEEYPELPSLEDARTIEMAIATLKTGLDCCLFATATEVTKQVLTGLRINARSLKEPERDKEGKIRTDVPLPTADFFDFIATDGHRMAIVSFEIEDKEMDCFGITIPGNALKEVQKMIKDTKEELIKISFGDSLIAFELGDRRIVSGLVSGDYPPCRQLIPQRYSRTMTCDRMELLKSLDLVAPMAQRNNLVGFGITENQLIVSTSDQTGEASQPINAQLTGDDIDFKFNIKYLPDGLKALRTTEVKMNANEFNQPVVFEPVGDLNFVYLIMPVQLRS